MELDDLNEQQQKAVKVVEGPLLIVAGAGTGKTKTLTTRVAYLVSEMKVDPKSILAITFTNKAADEMKKRVYRLIGDTADEIWISTFHSFGVSIIRNYGHLLGYKSNFTIMDSDDSTMLIKKVLKDLNYDINYFNPKGIKNKISSAKNELLSPLDYEPFANTDYEKVVLEVYQEYERRLKNSNALDFDDLLMTPITLFYNNPSVLAEYQERYKYILIDEYQDTNRAQYILSKMISAKYQNICVVGDPDQSIYSFRQADYKNILNFEHDYNKAQVITLEKNYRSSQKILDVANAIIKNNFFRKEKSLYTDLVNDIKPIYHQASDERDEAYYVINEIKKNGNSRVLSENAILYRTNAQSRNFEEVLISENIPYRVIGSYYFYKRKEIKDLISYLKLIYNNKDDVSLLRIINEPKRGIGEKTIADLTERARTENCSIYEVIVDGKEKQFKDIIENIKKEMDNLSLTELVDVILDKTNFLEQLKSEHSVEADIRIENLEEFKSITKTFEERLGIVSLDTFLEEISLVADREEYNEDKDGIILMTIHSAKGLEFDNVFVVGLEEGILPHVNSFESKNDIEEERRLCYVAITRAKKKLWLTNAKQRRLFGKDSMTIPSRFIKEIDEDMLSMSGSDFIRKEKPIFIDTDSEYKIGEKIRHDSYGEGIIVSIGNDILTVAFKHPLGIKKLMKGHRSIKKVEK